MICFHEFSSSSRSIFGLGKTGEGGIVIVIFSSFHSISISIVVVVVIIILQSCVFPKQHSSSHVQKFRSHVDRGCLA